MNLSNVPNMSIIPHEILEDTNSEKLNDQDLELWSLNFNSIRVSRKKARSIENLSTHSSKLKRNRSLSPYLIPTNLSYFKESGSTKISAKEVVKELVDKILDDVSRMAPYSHPNRRSINPLKSFSTPSGTVTKPHIPVQMVSPKKSKPIRISTSNDPLEEISPPCNYTRLGAAAKKWISMHPPYLTRNLEKELQENKPIQRNIIAMEKLKTPTKSQPSTPSKLPVLTSSVNLFTPIADNSPASSISVASPTSTSLKEKF